MNYFTYLYTKLETQLKTRNMETKLELSLEEVIILLKKLEYNYKKKGSPLIDKLKEFIENNNKK